MTIQYGADKAIVFSYFIINAYRIVKQNGSYLYFFDGLVQTEV